MAAQEQQNHESQNHNQEQEHYTKFLSSYLGLSFTIFLSFFPKNSISFISTLQNRNKALTFQLIQAEDQLKHLHSRRKEDSKANARVVEIFASHRHSWQQEEKRLLQQIDDGNEEIAYLKSKIEDFERMGGELRDNIEDLKKEIGERDEMLNFMSRNHCEVESSGGECYGEIIEGRYVKSGVSEDSISRGGDECFVGSSGYEESNSGFSSDFLNTAASRFWSEKASLWQDVQYESQESVYQLKHFSARRESPWKVDSDSTGISSKLKLLEQELLNMERVVKTDLSKPPLQMRKQAKRYQGLAGKIDDLCRRMQTSDPCEPTLSSEFRTQRQTEFLLEAFRLQQRASETNQKLVALQTESGKSYHGDELDGQAANIATRRSLDSIRNNFREIQRNLEIWLARIIGDLEGILARDGASRVRDYYISSSMARVGGPGPGPPWAGQSETCDNLSWKFAEM